MGCQSDIVTRVYFAAIDPEIVNNKEMGNSYGFVF